MRDNNLVERLNRLRVAALNGDDYRWFASRTISKQSPDYDAALPHLFPVNAAVQQHNAHHLALMPGARVDISAIDILPSLGERARNKLQNHVAKLDAQYTGGLLALTCMKMNSPVELTYNVDVMDGLTTGASGRLVNWGLQMIRWLLCCTLILLILSVAKQHEYCIAARVGD